VKLILQAVQQEGCLLLARGLEPAAEARGQERAGSARAICAISVIGDAPRSRGRWC
jgi:hypothetical protein